MLSTTAPAGLPDETQPISLVIDLVPGFQADLESISEASLHLVSALRAAIYIVAPEIELRVELQSGTEGSLSLNSLIRLSGATKIIERKTLHTLSLIALGWFGGHALDWTFDKVADAIYEHVYAENDLKTKQQPKLDHQEIVEIAEQLNKISRSPSVQNEVAKVYKNLNSDRAISGVGVKLNHSTLRPKIIVKKSSFQTRIASATAIANSSKIRDSTSSEVVRLISPVLDPTSRRKWRILSSDGPASASMEDQEFIRRLSDGSITTTLHTDTKLSVNITKIEQQGEDKKWRVKRLSITRVYRIILPKTQEELISSFGEEEPEDK